MAISKKDLVNIRKVKSLDKKIDGELKELLNQLNNISVFVGQIHEKVDINNIEVRLQKIDKLSKNSMHKFKKLKRNSVTIENIKRKIYDDLYTRYTPEEIKKI